MKHNNQEAKRDLFHQHIRLMNGDEISSLDREELKRTQNLVLPELNLGKRKNILQKYWQPISLVALLFVAVAPFIPAGSDTETIPAGYNAKGGHGVLVYWQRHNEVKRLSSYDGSLIEDDEVTVEVTAGEATHVFLAIYNKNNQRLNSEESFRTSQTNLLAGESRVIPKAFALTGPSEGEYLAVYLCNPKSLDADGALLKTLLRKSESLHENEQYIKNIVNCVITKRTLRQ